MYNPLVFEDYWYVYVLRSDADSRLYIGSTNNLSRRLHEHTIGKTRSTFKRRPLRLVYFEGHLSKEDAVRRERYLKSTPGRRSLHQMIRHVLMSFE